MTVIFDFAVLERADVHWLEAHGSLVELHVRKSDTYGAGADRFANFHAVAAITGKPPEHYVLQRVIEKATRALNMIEAGAADAVREYADLSSLSLCAEAMRRRRVAATESITS